VVMVSSLTNEGALATFEALNLGAVDYVAKPGGTFLCPSRGSRTNWWPRYEAPRGQSRRAKDYPRRESLGGCRRNAKRQLKNLPYPDGPPQLPMVC